MTQLLQFKDWLKKNKIAMMVIKPFIIFQKERNKLKYIQSIKVNYSRITNLKDAYRYTSYLNKSQKLATLNKKTPKIKELAQTFRNDGACSFWSKEQHELSKIILDKIKRYSNENKDAWLDNGNFKKEPYRFCPEVEQLFKKTQLGDFLEEVYSSHYRIFYGLIYKSERKANESPIGSQLWHTDGGPGTCINLMFYLSSAKNSNGPLELLSWKDSLEIYKKEINDEGLYREIENAKAKGLSRQQIRTIKCNYFEKQIKKDFNNKIFRATGKSGLIVAFRNNNLHKGGYPQVNESRYVCIFHIYPYRNKTPWEFYQNHGIEKKAPFLSDPYLDQN